MPEAQDTQIHLPCQHFRCDSFRFDKQKRRLGEWADAMADASQHGAEDHRHTRGHNPEHPQANYGRGPCQEMAPDQRPTCLAVDGFAVHKGHRYATCVMDLGNGDVLWVGKGRPEADFAKFFEESGLEWLRGVKAVAMDRNASCNKLVKRHMPWADIVYDRCHMQAQYGKDVLGVVRLQEACRGSILCFRPRPRPVPIRTSSPPGGPC